MNRLLIILIIMIVAVALVFLLVLVIEVLQKLSKVLDSVQDFFDELNENDISLAEIVLEEHERKTFGGE